MLVASMTCPKVTINLYKADPTDFVSLVSNPTILWYVSVSSVRSVNSLRRPPLSGSVTSLYLGCRVPGYLARVAEGLGLFRFVDVVECTFSPFV